MQDMKVLRPQHDVLATHVTFAIATSPKRHIREYAALT